MRRDIRRSVTYRHPVDRVWRALTDPEALAVWLMPNDFVPRVGHRFQFRTDPAPGFDGIVDCEVLALDPPRLLQVSWDGGPVDATVTWQLAPVADGTRLDFAMTGFEGPKAVAVSAVLGAGFAGMYRRNLPTVLDRLAAGRAPGAARDEGECQPGLRDRVLARVAAVLPGRR